MPHSTSRVSAKVLLCLILPPVFQKGTSVPHSTSCGSYQFLCFSKGTSVPHSTPCGSHHFPCFRKGISVPHSTSCVSATVLLCFILPHVAHMTSCVSAKVFLTLRASLQFRHLPPNSARFSYATEGALFISAQLSSDAVSALRKVRILT